MKKFLKQIKEEPDAMVVFIVFICAILLFVVNVIYNLWIFFIV